MFFDCDMDYDWPGHRPLLDVTFGIIVAQHNKGPGARVPWSNIVRIYPFTSDIYCLMLFCQILHDLFATRDSLLPALEDESAEYFLLRNVLGISEDTTQTPNYFDEGMAEAAVQILHNDDAWHDIVVRHFKPVTVVGDWAMGSPSNCTLMAQPPSKRVPVVKRGPTNKKLYSWTWYPKHVPRLYDEDEIALEEIMASLDRSDQTRFWKTPFGKDQFKEWFAYLMYRRPAMQVATERMLLSQQRTERLIRYGYSC